MDLCLADLAIAYCNLLVSSLRIVRAAALCHKSKACSTVGGQTGQPPAACETSLHHVYPSDSI